MASPKQAACPLSQGGSFLQPMDRACSTRPRGKARSRSRGTLPKTPLCPSQPPPHGPWGSDRLPGSTGPPAPLSLYSKASPAPVTLCQVHILGSSLSPGQAPPQPPKASFLKNNQKTLNKQYKVTEAKTQPEVVSATFHEAESRGKARTDCQ